MDQQSKPAARWYAGLKVYQEFQENPEVLKQACSDWRKEAEACLDGKHAMESFEFRHLSTCLAGYIDSEAPIRDGAAMILEFESMMDAVFDHWGEEQAQHMLTHGFNSTVQVIRRLELAAELKLEATGKRPPREAPVHPSEFVASGQPLDDGCCPCCNEPLVVGYQYIGGGAEQLKVADEPADPPSYDGFLAAEDQYQAGGSDATNE